jgi:hypothetical protein
MPAYTPDQIDEGAVQIVGVAKQSAVVLWEVEKELTKRPLLKRVVGDVALNLDTAQFANPITDLANSAEERAVATEEERAKLLSAHQVDRLDEVRGVIERVLPDLPEMSPWGLALRGIARELEKATSAEAPTRSAA